MRESRPSSRRPRGFTLTEIAVVALLATLMIGAAILIWSRTGSITHKGAGLLDLQQILQAITHSLRSDIRTLVSVKSCEPTKLTFLVRRKDRDVEITYRFDEGKRTLIRNEGDSAETDFHGAHQVKAVSFEAKPGIQDFEYLEVALELETPAPKGAPASSLAVVHRFSSRSLNSPFEVVK